MEPMFLPEVETGPGSGQQADVIKMMRSAGQVVPQILHLFAYKAGVTEHLARFS